MWREIRLEALGVIEEAVLELRPGFTVITGETGAGKTLVVTALGLLRGARADPGLVRHGASRCRVEARVQVGDLAEVTRRTDEAGGDVDDGELILARTVTAEGRSRAYVGGAGVPAGTLASVTELLVAVHGQSDQHRLLRAAAQRAALDRYAGTPVAELLAGYQPAYRRRREVTAILHELVDRATERQRELELLRLGLDEIAAVEPQPGEDEQLRAEEDRLAHVEALRAATSSAHAGLAGGDESAADAAGADAATLLATARRVLDAERGHDPAVAVFADRAADLSYQLVDLAADLAAYSTDVDADPARLAAVQERRSLLAALARRYGSGADDVLAWARTSARRLSELEGDDDRIDTLRAEGDVLTDRLLTIATELSRARQSAAAALAAAVNQELGALAMPNARIRVDVRTPEPATPEALGPDGADEVELLLAANAGAPARPLAKGTSGGELSRVMLALEVVLAGTGETPTFVFDEVDAGVGGSAAIEVGRRLARLARSAQVVAVTHLPQVAAFADSHHRVRKRDDGSVTTSGVQALDDAARVEELARMLAGVEDSATARAHAQELLDVAAGERARADR